jgi:hypothetical protein
MSCPHPPVMGRLSDEAQPASGPQSTPRGRQQLAVVRAIADELARSVARRDGLAPTLRAQLAHELGRLGYGVDEAAAWLGELGISTAEDARSLRLAAG